MTTPLQPYWIGYHTLNTWLASIDDGRPVFASLASETSKPDPRGLWMETLFILVAQPAGDLLHYCRLPVASLRYVESQPFDPDHAQRRQAANQDWLNVRAWLVVHGLTVVDGLVAAPVNVRLLDAVSLP